jgi:hypothetical protein
MHSVRLWTPTIFRTVIFTFFSQLTGPSHGGVAETEFGPLMIYSDDDLNHDFNRDLNNTESEERLSKKDSRDALTSIIGEFGLYQTVWCTLLGLTELTFGWLHLGNKFLTAKVHQLKYIKRIVCLFFVCSRPVWEKRDLLYL